MVRSFKFLSEGKIARTLSKVKKHTSKYSDFLVKIEINSNIESLNISNSAAIVFHHINQQKKS